jgi:hypothetical protein
MRHARPRATESSAITDVKAPGPAKRDKVLHTTPASGSVPKGRDANRLSARVGANAPPTSLVRTCDADDTTGRTIVRRRQDVAHDRVQGTRSGPCAVPLDAHLSRTIRMTAFTGA